MEHNIKFYQWYTLELHTGKDFYYFWLTIQKLFGCYMLHTPFSEINIAVSITPEYRDYDSKLSMKMYFSLRPGDLPVITALNPMTQTLEISSSDAIRLLKELHLYNRLNKIK